MAKSSGGGAGGSGGRVRTKWGIGTVVGVDKWGRLRVKFPNGQTRSVSRSNLRKP